MFASSSEKQYKPIELTTRLKLTDQKSELSKKFDLVIFQEWPFKSADNDYCSTELGIKHSSSIAIEWVGKIAYKTVSDSLFISDMNNTSHGKYKNVGAALHEFAFRKSIEMGYEGRITLHATPKGIFFHYKMGFLPITDKVFEVSPKYRGLLELCQEYHKTKADVLKEKILAYDEYVLSDANKIALEKLQRDPSFEEMIIHGVFSQISDHLEAELIKANGKIITEYTGGYPDLYSGHPMYLSKEAIHQKKLQYKILVKLPPQLDISDLVYLHENCLALRHQEEGVIQKEIIEGGRGDALSLAAPLISTVKSLTHEDEQHTFGIKKQYLNKNGYYDKEKYGQGLDSKMEARLLHNHGNPRNLLEIDDSEEKWSSEQIILDFQKGIYQFILTNNLFFLGGEHHQSAYLLLQRPSSAQKPRDIREYHGLGKCGTSHFEKDAICSSIVREEEEKWDTDTIYLKVIMHIKTLTQNYKDNPHSYFSLHELEKRGWKEAESKLPTLSVAAPIKALTCMDQWKILFEENPVVLSMMMGGISGLLFFQALPAGTAAGLIFGILVSKVKKSQYHSRFFQLHSDEALESADPLQPSPEKYKLD